MKKYYFVMLLSLCSMLFSYAASPQSEITFEKKSHNFGKFSESKPVVKCKFTFTNTGDAPLIINQALASCGCTIPSYTEKPIAPGEKGEISITYNGTGRYSGPFKKVITIRSNAKNNIVRLYIEGDMTPAEQESK